MTHTALPTYTEGGGSIALVPASIIYDEAAQQGYAVGVFPANSMDAVQGVLEAVRKTRVPALLTVSNLFFGELNDLGAYVHYVRHACRRVDVPVALHLDHGNVQTFDEVKSCVGHGFTSVMYDASRLPLDENIRRTREVTAYCHQRGVTVEGMIGHMPLGNTGEFNEAKKAELGGLEEGAAVDDRCFTKPEEAELFDRETGVDVMAVSVGTIHGLTDREVTIDVDRLREIRRRTGAHLTIHGGSGLPAAEIRKLLQNGVVKINVFSGIARRLTSHLRDRLAGGEELIFLYGGRYVIEEEVTRYIRLFTGG